MSEYRVLWTGSREGWPMPFIDVIAGQVLDHVRRRNLQGEDVHLKVAHGGAKGVDARVGNFFDIFGITSEVWLPDWEGLGKKAGIIRNGHMVDEFDPNLVVGLTWSGSKGATHCVSYARDRGIPLLNISYENDPAGAAFPR